MIFTKILGPLLEFLAWSSIRNPSVSRWFFSCSLFFITVLNQQTLFLDSPRVCVILLIYLDICSHLFPRCWIISLSFTYLQFLLSFSFSQYVFTLRFRSLILLHFTFRFCFLTAEAMFSWKKNRYITVRVLRIVWNVYNVILCVFDFQLFKPL